MKDAQQRILFSGGGTLGPVMPLVSIIQELRRLHDVSYDFLWVGTYGGVEHAVVRAHNISFRGMLSIKLRRYVTVKHVIEFFKFPFVFFQAWWILHQYKPDMLVTAGGYVSVPLHFIAWLKRIPTLVHHQDIRSGLANRIMRRFATISTCTFKHTLKEMKEGRMIWTGNPIRSELRLGDRDRSLVAYKLNAELPTVLVFGGGTGAMRLNYMIADIVPKLVKVAQVIHITGQGKDIVVPRITDASLRNRYQSHAFLMDQAMADAYSVADIVVCRAGLSTLSELAFLKKSAIIIPLIDSHQEENAGFFLEQGAVIVVSEKEGSGVLRNRIFELLEDSGERERLSQKIGHMNSSDAHVRISQLIERTCT